MDRECVGPSVKSYQIAERRMTWPSLRDLEPVETLETLNGMMKSNSAKWIQKQARLSEQSGNVLGETMQLFMEVIH